MTDELLETQDSHWRRKSQLLHLAGRTLLMGLDFFRRAGTAK
jgi:hypothetical protein